MRPRTKDREDLIEAACELFSQADYHNVAMDEIAKAARVAKGTLYLYFDSKEDLYVSIIRVRLERLVYLLEQAYEDRQDVWRNLRSYLVHLDAFFRKHQHFFELWVRESGKSPSNNNKELHRLNEKFVSLLKRVLDQGVREGDIRLDIPTDWAAVRILGMIEAEVREHINRRTPHDERLVDSMMTQIMSGLTQSGTEQS
jgi:AcrR family transcriptional regulator